MEIDKFERAKQLKNKINTIEFEISNMEKLLQTPLLESTLIVSDYKTSYSATIPNTMKILFIKQIIIELKNELKKYQDEFDLL